MCPLKYRFCATFWYILVLRFDMSKGNKIFCTVGRVSSSFCSPACGNWQPWFQELGILFDPQTIFIAPLDGRHWSFKDKEKRCEIFPIWVLYFVSYIIHYEWCLWVGCPGHNVLCDGHHASDHLLQQDFSIQYFSAGTVLVLTGLRRLDFPALNHSFCCLAEVCQRAWKCSCPGLRPIIIFFAVCYMLAWVVKRKPLCQLAI